MNTCLCCYEDFLVKCGENIQVFAKMTPDTQYFWIITDKFDRQYQGRVTTDEDGFCVILTGDLPAGLLTEFSGSFKLQFFEETNSCAPVTFTIAQQTDCINFTLRAGNREKNNLGCGF